MSDSIPISQWQSIVKAISSFAQKTVCPSQGETVPPVLYIAWDLRSTPLGHQKVFQIEKSISLETHSFCADTSTYPLSMKFGIVIFFNFGVPAECFLNLEIHSRVAAQDELSFNMMGELSTAQTVMKSKNVCTYWEEQISLGLIHLISLKMS